MLANMLGVRRANPEFCSRDWLSVHSVMFLVGQMADAYSCFNGEAECLGFSGVALLIKPHIKYQKEP